MEHGSFADMSFAMVLIRALDKRWSGALTIEPPDGNTHRIQLDRGLVCRVLVADGYARLGDVVVRAGVITNEELDDVLEGAGPLGDAMIRAHLIDNKTLKRALLLQLLKRMTRIFGQPVATSWHYSPFDNPFEGMPETVRIDTLRALWAGISVHGESGSRLAKALQRIGASPLRLRDGVNIRRFGFTGDAAQLVELISRRSTTLRALLRKEITPSDVCQRIIYVLAITRHLDFTPVGKDLDDAGGGPSTEDIPSSDLHQSAPPHGTKGDDAGAAGQRVARIKLRRVAVRRSVAGDGRPSDEVPTEPTGAAPPAAQRTQISEHELRSWLERLDRQSPLEILGVTREQLAAASESDVQELLWRRHGALSGRWHPDNAPPQRPDLRTGMVRIYRAITIAFDTLIDPAQRQKTLVRPAAGAGPDPVSSGPRPVSPSAGADEVGAAIDRPARRPMRAMRPTTDSTIPEQASRTLTSVSPPAAARGKEGGDGSGPASGMYLHERSLIALSVERYEEALRYCQQACRADPDNTDYRASCIWIRARIGEQSTAELLAELDALLDKTPEHVAARYYRGVLRKRMHYHDGAERDFQRVLRLEPKHEGAKSQLVALKQARGG